MHRTIALLDCKNTLLINEHINVNLVKALRKKNISDIYLFTGTVLMKNKVMTRKQVVKYLQENGFIVHGIITPLDLAWDKILIEEIKLLYSYNPEIFPVGRNLSTGFKEVEKFYNFLEFHRNIFPKLFEATLQYIPQGKELGKAFSEAEKELEKYGDISEFTQLRSFCVKVIVYYLSKKYQYAHVKELLLDLFFRYCPSWVSDVVIADNSIVLSMHITKFQPLDDTIFFPPITMMPIIEDNSVDYYEKILDEHFRKISKKLPTNSNNAGYEGLSFKM